MLSVVPHVKGQGSKSFMFNGAKKWNELPNYMKCIESKDDFKDTRKQYLFKKMEEKEQSRKYFVGLHCRLYV